MKRNNSLDLYRAILTIFVLLYHLGLCEAGFLAVCGFFTLSGCLLAKTIDNRDFNLKDYYLKRLKSLYLPLVIVVFVTIFVFRYLVDIPWVSIKQETLSVLFNYSNFFQIKANNNYFIRSDASPFTHMWYISILIQIEFVLPLVFYVIKKIEIELNRKVIFSLTILSIVCFVVLDYRFGMAHSYYNTISRLFSFLIGMSVYYIDYFGLDNKPALITLIVIVGLFFSRGWAQKYYVVLMILVSLLSGLFILFSTYSDFKETKIVTYICKISYFVYLVQYPIIYIVDSGFDYSKTIKIIIEFVSIILVSCIFAYGLSSKENKIRKAITLLIIVITAIGGFGYLTCPDYQKQMEELKAQLETNQEMLEQKQAAYLQKIKEQQTSMLNDVSQIDGALNNLEQTTKDAQILLIGDSIMLGGSFHLDEYFNNYYCDAKGSRNGFLAYETLSELLDMGVVGDYIVIHLGTNSGLELEEVESIASLLTDQKVLWLTVTNGWRTSENPMLEQYCNEHENNYLADWYTYSLGHKEYFVEDGLHLSDDGRHVYDQFIFDNLKEIIREDLSNKKQKMIEDFNTENNNTISFYGNDLLINISDKIVDDYMCYSNSDYTFDVLYSDLKNNKENLCLSKTVFILLDGSLILTDEEINKINELLNDNKVHIFAYNQSVNDLNKLLTDDCYLQDGIHLNEKGNEKLLKEINSK